ncbi:c-type cytochrome [Pendulispora albinea]|uniref:Cytochrome c domain-containing protein n=1 Tax=Pendulispora albinea TaxID=2741071 RepID=A0ABZ2LMG6_9BACT
MESHEKIPQRTSATVDEALDTFNNLAGEILLRCGNCHKSPAQQGDFSYDGTREGLCKARGKNHTPAEMMISGQMPKGVGGEEALGRRLKAWIDQGCSAGTYKLPKGDTPVNPGGDLQTSREVGAAMTDLGSCIPSRAILGHDATADTRFAAMRSFSDLPAKLSETDVVSLDSEALARKGTISYAPAYPLWTDDAGKLRFVHVPEGQSISYDAQTKQFRIPPNTRFYKTFLKSVVEADGVKRYRKMETRIIVTRERSEDAIFGTYVWNAEETGAKLLGTGLNPDAPDKLETYLNGKPFADWVRPYVTDEKPQAMRSYAVPGSERCIACHTGSEAKNFILGFTPLQINRRAKDEGGVYDGDVLASELDQAERLIAYGVITGVSAADLPKLETSAAPRKPRNDDELRMQAYMVGNCVHCHNPNGYAVQSNPALRKFNLAPGPGGSVFGFDFATKGADDIPHFVKVPDSISDTDVEAALTLSRFYTRVTLPTGAYDTNAFGGPPTGPNSPTAFFSFHMPLHSPGIDCRLPVLLARWWGSVPRDYRNKGVEVPGDATAMIAAKIVAFRAEERARRDCKPAADIDWVLEDGTERDPYIPRNIDWPTKMDKWVKDLSVTQGHEDLGKKTYYQGYFDPKCNFPNSPEPPAPAIEEWMIDPVSKKPRMKWGALYATTPGAHIYAGICANCHGVHGDGQTGAARALRATSGAFVANFADGLFGPRRNPAANVDCFDHGSTSAGCSGGLGKNGAAKYLVWMATGGTNVSFGRTVEEEKTFFDAFVSSRAITAVPLPVDFTKGQQAFKNAKANMLGVARVTCDRFRTDADGIEKSYDKAVAGKNWDLLVANQNWFGLPLWRDVCTLDNPLTPQLRAAAANSPEVEAWLQRAVFNAGTMVFMYLRDELSKGGFTAPRNACEIKYPME